MLTQRHEEKRVGEHGSMEEKERERERERERETVLWVLFVYIFPSPGLPYANWAGQERCLFYLRSSLRSSDLPLTFPCSIFSGFFLPCLLATSILDSCFLY